MKKQKPLLNKILDKFIVIFNSYGDHHETCNCKRKGDDCQCGFIRVKKIINNLKKATFEALVLFAGLIPLVILALAM